MAGISLATAQTALDAAVAAHMKAMEKGQAYAINTGGSGRNLQRANLAELQKAVEYWQQMVQTLSASGAGRRRSYNIVSG